MNLLTGWLDPETLSTAVSFLKRDYHRWTVVDDTSHVEEPYIR